MLTPTVAVKHQSNVNVLVMNKDTVCRQQKQITVDRKFCLQVEMC